MPAKGRRVASRQAQLGRRRKRQGRSSGDGNVGPVNPAAETQPSAGRTSTATETAERSPAPVNQPSAPPRPEAATSPFMGRSQPRPRAERPMAYNYVGKEVLRILCLAGGMVAILVVLAFVLPL